ncbi:aminotransferase class V-fold PLP-dependent enzyme [Candidatus Saccharibacteria bacterium]|nr:aminotransferase class V-fold PLP-dependent enzyme [Candidatus Saccharibacteria bacterium]MCB9834644.1 aminotransferase class V-fold PLP-dependent enzyme [Candidatus Nomurabacteria bacterium]
MINKLYLDYAAATPIDSTVLDQMLGSLQYFANPSSSHSLGMEARKVLHQQKQRIAMVIGAKTQDIILTSGGSESDNLALHKLKLGQDPVVITTHAEHKASAKSIEALGLETFYLDLDQKGRINLIEFERILKLDRPTLVVIGMISIEVGLVRDLKLIKKIIYDDRKRRSDQQVDHSIYWHCDGSGAGGLLPYRVEAIGADSLSLNAAKIYGPKGSGALYLSDRAKKLISPLVLGGGQQAGLRSGTESIFLATGLASALELSDKKRKLEVQRLRDLKKLFARLIQAELPSESVIINSSSDYHLANYLHLSLPGRRGLELMSQLDARGVIVSTSSACDASDQEVSPVLLALGMELELASSSLRVTLGRATSNDDIIRLVKGLKEII